MLSLSKYDSPLFYRELVPDNGIFDSVQNFLHLKKQ